MRKADNRNELLRWIFEIHSTFTMNASVSNSFNHYTRLSIVYFQPLYIGLPQAQTDSINRWLDIHQPDPNEDLK